MGMVVKNNMSAVRTLNTLNSNTSALQKSLQKVSSGMKINSAQDDASGYAISERMRVRIRSLDQANQNSQNDSSLMKTAEGAVGNTVEILRALKEKAINAANDSNTDEDRQTIQKEINQFIDQIDDNALVQFNGKYLVDGSKNNAFYETKSILLNQSLRTGTSASSALTELYNRAGDSLGIQTTDQYQVSWVQNGTIHFTSGSVGKNNISDILTLKPEGAKDPISQVAATDKTGLIAAAAEAESGDMYNTSFTYDPATVTTAQAIIDAYKKTNPTAGGAATNIADLVKTFTFEDNSTKDVPLFAKNADGTDPVTGTINLKSDGTTYEITGLSTDNTTPVEIFQLNKNYEPTQIKYEDTPTTKDVYTHSNAVTVSSLDKPFSNAQASTANQKLTDLLATLSDDEIITNYGLEENSKDFSWSLAKSDGTALVIDDYYIWKNNTGDKLYIGTTAGDTDSAVDGCKLSLSYKKPVQDDTVVEESLDEAWDKFGKAVYTPDKTQGVAFAAEGKGVDNQISGLTISILDQDGNVKKAANAALDQFKQYQRAENETGDMSLNFHIGSEANVSFKVGMGDMRSQALGLKGSDGTRIDVYTKEHANAAINVIENALTKALDQQTTIGAIEARLEYTSTNLTTSSENVQAAESTIRDADMAKEMTNYTKSNVLLQAAQAMLAQANQNSSAVLSLLQ